MTREEAIKNIKEHCYFANLIPQAKEALEMAIKALEQEPKADSWSIRDVADTFKKHGLIREQDPCEDAIDRAEAVRVASGYCHPANVAKELAKLPPVTPQPKTGHWKVVSDGYGNNAYICECSECKNTVWVYKDTNRKWNYCPSCGAKML